MSADVGYDVQRPSLVFADFTKYTQQDLERWHKESDISFGGMFRAACRLCLGLRNWPLYDV